MKYILERWIGQHISYSAEDALATCNQFDNVLRNCDVITYDEDGAAAAYIILHFLDRFHRFQVTFDTLHELGLMPSRKDIHILDVGTGPGPSMYAVSDFYKDRIWNFKREQQGRSRLSIDYAERSDSFRNWLHHFTELANWMAPSGVEWDVPYHHGKTTDFADIDFNRKRILHERDDDGEEIRTDWVEKSRPDLVVMSNFLTTEEQAESLALQIRDCARNLRHNGIFLVVGAKRSNPKYARVYEIIDRAVLDGRYSTYAYKAWCTKISLETHILEYQFQDEWGTQLKRFLGNVQKLLKASLGEAVPPSVQEKLITWAKDDYSHGITWEITVYRKSAIPRRTRPSHRREHTTTGQQS